MHLQAACSVLNKSLATQFFKYSGMNKISGGISLISTWDCHMCVLCQLTGANKAERVLTHTSTCVYTILIVAELLLAVLALCKLILIAC